MDEAVRIVCSAQVSTTASKYPKLRHCHFGVNFQNSDFPLESQSYQNLCSDQLFQLETSTVQIPPRLITTLLHMASISRIILKDYKLGVYDALLNPSSSTPKWKLHNHNHLGMFDLLLVLKLSLCFFVLTMFFLTLSFRCKRWGFSV